MRIVTQAMTMSLAEDRPRVQATEREDRLAFEALVHRQTRFVFRVVNAMPRNAGDAEEMAQETFLKLHRGEPGAKRPRPYGQYLGRIVEA
jgi:DNA-directed RNA polymerase specialized sigma24 family protein